MKMIRIQTIFAFLISCSLSVSAQQMDRLTIPPTSETRVPVVAVNPLTVSIESGRFDPNPNCKKDVQTCFYDGWTATNQFQSGTPVWLKVTVLNHSDLTASDITELGSDYFIPDVHENTTGMRPKLTSWGCRVMPSDCPTHRSGSYALNPPGGYWEIPPGKSKSTFVAVARYFVFTNPGEYTVSVRSGGFNLTTEHDNFGLIAIDEKTAKRSGALSSGEVKFVIVK